MNEHDDNPEETFFQFIARIYELTPEQSAEIRKRILARFDDMLAELDDNDDGTETNDHISRISCDCDLG